MRSRSTAILLALLLGGGGIQWFYLNKPSKGVVSLLFAWTFIPAFIALYQVVKWLLMSDEAWQKQYS
jgi:TM2 domain-containing membrane protein YozV